MATIGDLWVNIGADTSDFERNTRKLKQQLKGFGNEMKAMALESQKKLEPFKQQLREVRGEFFQMAQGMNQYKGSNQDFMNELETLGKKQKKITDEMMKNNDLLKTGFITGVATMLARSTSSEKIAANFDRMRNPLYRVNNGLLAITGNMEKMAARGQPAALALSMLGPTANMKELNDMVMLINQGLMRHQMVTIAAAIASVVLYSSLHKAATNSIPEYANAWKTMGKTMREAFQPMVDVFAMVMTKVYEFITAIGNLMIRFNEAHPLLAKMIQGFVMLLPALFLLLAPLSIGIGLFNGMKAAFAATWMLIKPLIVGLAAMSGTVLIVAAAIVLVSVALWALWTKTDWFKGAVIGAWNEIKAAAVSIWNFIYANGIKPAIDAISKYVLVTMTQLKLFWFEHGEQIKQIISIAWSFIKGIFLVQLNAIVTILKIAFINIKTTISVVLQTIKLVIDLFLNTVGGLFKFWMAIFKGDWKGALEAIQGIVKGNLTAVVDYITGLGKTFYNAGKGLIEQMKQGIENAAATVIKSVKEIAGKIRDFLPFSPAKTGPLSDLDQLDFGGPVSDSLTKAIPTVRGMLTDLVTLPTINANGIGGAAVASGGDTYHMNIQLNASDLEEMQTVYDFFNSFRQTKRAR